jgi:hypothetical protein
MKEVMSFSHSDFRYVDGERAEGRGQRAEGRGQRAEGRGQRAEGRGQRAEGRGERAEGRGQRGIRGPGAIRVLWVFRQRRAFEH